MCVDEFFIESNNAFFVFGVARKCGVFKQLHSKNRVINREKRANARKLVPGANLPIGKKRESTYR